MDVPMPECRCNPASPGPDNSWPDGPPLYDEDCPVHGQPEIVVAPDTDDHSVEKIIEKVLLENFGRYFEFQAEVLIDALRDEGYAITREALCSRSGGCRG